MMKIKILIFTIILLFMQSSAASNKPAAANDMYELFKKDKVPVALMRQNSCYSQCPIDSQGGIGIACWIGCMEDRSHVE